MLIVSVVGGDELLPAHHKGGYVSIAFADALCNVAYVAAICSAPRYLPATQVGGNSHRFHFYIQSPPHTPLSHCPRFDTVIIVATLSGHSSQFKPTLKKALRTITTMHEQTKNLGRPCQPPPTRDGR